MRRTYHGSCHCGAVRFECEIDLTHYAFGSNNIHHLFCRHCGVKSFGRGHMDELGGTVYAIDLACLDDATDEEPAAAPVIHQDGRNNNWGGAAGRDPPPLTERAAAYRFPAGRSR